MAVIVNSRPISLQTGQRTIGRENVPDALGLLLFTLRYCTTSAPLIWPNAATVIRAVAWQSNDGGLSWMKRSTWSTFGGIHIVKGLEVPETTWGFGLLPGVNREISIDLEIENGPLNTELTLVTI